MARAYSLFAEKSHDPSTALIVAQIGSFLWMLALGPLAMLLLIVANSGRGHLFAGTALLTAILPLTATISRRKKTARWTAVVICGSVCWTVLMAAVFASAPSGGQYPGHRVMHAYAGTKERFSRYSVANLLPEGDQLQLGFSIMPLLDPLLTTNQTGKLKALTAPIYDDLERDPEFRELGSAMSGSYGELIGYVWESGHSYVYIPKQKIADRPMPVLVFFHGSGGNFKAYLWILSKLADESGFAVVAPSNGLGNWTEESSAKGLNDALAAVSRVTAVDRSRIHVMGLSNGGLAISQLAETQGSQFASMIFMSPVFATSSVRSSSFARECAGRRVLVLTGSQDDRVPLDYVEENTERIKRDGARVTLKSFDDADHFLLFSHRDTLLPVLRSWLLEEK